jgi:hypothetical protein
MGLNKKKLMKQVLENAKQRLQTKEEDMKEKKTERVRITEEKKVERVKINQTNATVTPVKQKVPVSRIRLPENEEKEWRGLIPRSPEWKLVWIRYNNKPEQKEMLKYREEYYKRHPEENTDLKEVTVDKRKKEEEERKRMIEEHIKKKGLQNKPGKGEAAPVLDYEDELDDENEEEDEPTPVQTKKSKPTLRSVKVETKKEEVREVKQSVNVAFGHEGRTIDNADPIPSDVNSLKQLIKWMLSSDHPILELDKRDMKIKAYPRKRKTSTGRIAELCVKAQGEEYRATYRSNKSSKRD